MHTEMIQDAYRMIQNAYRMIQNAYKGGYLLEAFIRYMIANYDKGGNNI